MDGDNFAIFRGFLDPGYGKEEGVDSSEIDGQWQSFVDDQMEKHLVEGQAPADGYFFKAHMGAFLRKMAEAKMHFTIAAQAQRAKRLPRSMR